MKKIILVFSLISIISCKKNSNCLECKTNGSVNGVDYNTPPNQKSATWCQDGSAMPVFTDASGNQIPYSCK